MAEYWPRCLTCGHWDGGTRPTYQTLGRCRHVHMNIHGHEHCSGHTALRPQPDVSPAQRRLLERMVQGKDSLPACITEEHPNTLKFRNPSGGTPERVRRTTAEALVRKGLLELYIPEYDDPVYLVTAAGRALVESVQGHMLLCKKCEGFGALHLLRCDVCGYETHRPDYPDTLDCGHSKYTEGIDFDCPTCAGSGKDESSYERIAKDAARIVFGAPCQRDIENVYFWLWFENAPGDFASAEDAAAKYAAAHSLTK